MNGRSKIKAIAVAGAVASALLVTGPVQALDVNTTSTIVSSGSANGTVPNPLGGSGPDNLGGGMFTFTRDVSNPGSAPALRPALTATDKFIGFCLEFNETLAGGTSYDLVSLSAAPISANGALPFGMGTVKADHLVTLLQNVFPDFGNLSDPDIVNDTGKLALQIAIWEIVHETTKNTLGNFVYNASADAASWTSSSPSGAIAQANLWLGNLNTAIGTGIGIANAATSTFRAIVNKTGAKSQDFVVQLRTDAPPPVPLPAAAWLLGSGLLGLFGLARRRQKTGEA